jgi:molybdenum cofactor cytidylyltransferase
MDNAMNGNYGQRIFAVILAAGEGSRFGRLKQIEPIVGESTLLGMVIGYVMRCATFYRVVLVLGAEADAVTHALSWRADDDKLDIVVNEEYAQGMSTSLRTGIEAARRGGADAVAILLGDMPLIDHRILETMLWRYISSDSALCYAKAGGHTGPPIIVRKDLFDEFLAVEGDIGGREIVRKYIDSALEVDLGMEGINPHLDIDDEADLRELLTLLRGRHAS